jgi:hypothetical protein
MKLPLEFAEAVVVLGTLEHQLLAEDSCLSKHFYGSYRDGQELRSVFVPPQSCLDSADFGGAGSGHFTVPWSPIQQLVWIESVEVDPSLHVDSSVRNADAAALFISRLEAKHSAALVQHTGQTVMDMNMTTRAYEYLYSSTKASLLSISRTVAREVDLLLPPFWKSSLLPSASILPYPPISEDTLKLLKKLNDDLVYDPLVAALVNDISLPQMKNDLRFLTGEDTTSNILTRHSFAPDTLIAARWIKERIEGTGATCEFFYFLDGFAPNVKWYDLIDCYFCLGIIIKSIVATPLWSTQPVLCSSLGIMTVVVPSEAPELPEQMMMVVELPPFSLLQGL